MILLKKPLVLFSLFFLLAFVSCSARIEGELREGGSAELTLKTSLEPRTEGIIRSLMGFMGETADAPILDGPAMSRSMAAAPGIRSVTLRNTGPSALEGAIFISRVGDFLVSNPPPHTAAPGSGDAKSGFIAYTEGRETGMSSLVITLNRDSAPELIARFSPEVEEYLSALMAPVVLGENSAKQEYLDILTMVYGQPLADEIAAARIRMAVDFPRPVQSVQGGKAAGKRAEFDIPLVDLLVLEQPLRYEVHW